MSAFNTVAARESALRVAFFKQLQQLANKIHATQNVDEIMLDLSAEVCDLFDGDRLTIYSISEDKQSMVSKVKTGLASFKQLKLPISAQSIAGYAGLSKKLLNLLDVYDEAELRSHAPDLCFQQGVDKRTGYRTRQMLVAPILAAADGQLLGVVQLINNRRGGAFPELVEEGVRYLCETLAVAFTQRHKTPQRDRWRFANVLPEAALPRLKLDAALRTAAARGCDVEDVLIDETGLKIGLVGRALAEFFGVPYMPFHSERRKPVELLASFNREYVVQNQWLPIEEGKNGLYILCTDPEQVKQSGAVARIFPQSRPIFCVTTRREFAWMVNHCLGAPEPEVEQTSPPISAATIPVATAAPVAAAAVSAAPSGSSAELPAPAQEQLLKHIAAMVVGSHQQGMSDLRFETFPGKLPGEIRFQVSGTIKVG